MGAIGPLDIEGADLGQGCGGRGLSGILYTDCINFVVSNYYESLGCYASGEPAIRHASENLCSLPLCCFTCCSKDRTCVTCNLRRDRMQILKTKTSKSSNSVASFEVFADFGVTINAGLFIQHVILTPLKAAQ